MNGDRRDNTMFADRVLPSFEPPAGFSEAPVPLGIRRRPPVWTAMETPSSGNEVSLVDKIATPAPLSRGRHAHGPPTA